MLIRCFWSVGSAEPRQASFTYLLICFLVSLNGSCSGVSQKTQLINFLYLSNPIAAVRLRIAVHSARSFVGPANVRCRVTFDSVWINRVTLIVVSCLKIAGFPVASVGGVRVRPETSGRIAEFSEHEAD